MYNKLYSVVQYSSSLTSEPFLYEETKIIAKLKLSGFKDGEIRAKVIEENLLNYKSIKQAKRIIPVILRRMIFLDDYLSDVLINGNEKDSKIVALYLVMKNNLLFYEFVKEVYAARIYSSDNVITKGDIVNFFEVKKKESSIVANWKTYVITKLGQVYINILYKSGLLKDIKKRGVVAANIEGELGDYIIGLGDKRIIEVFINNSDIKE